MRLFFPDSLWHRDQVSGAAFLYFGQEKILFTLHPSVSTFLIGVDAFRFLPYVEDRRPPWKGSFEQFFGMWRFFRTSLSATQNLVEPLRNDAFRTAQFVYDRGVNGWKNARDILESSKLKRSEVAPLVDSYHAADELFAHIFFEKVLESLYSDKSQEDLFKLGMEAAKLGLEGVPEIAGFDWAQVYEYCDQLFSKNALPDLLSQAYMFRMPILHSSGEILLSNNGVIKLLASLPVESAETGEPDSAQIVTDVIAWEFFRQLVSPFVDPLDEKKVMLIKQMLTERQNEIGRLKNKCFDLAAGIGSQNDLRLVVDRVRDYIKGKVLNELEDLLKLDKRAFSKFVSDLFSDEKNWIAVSAFLYGPLTAARY